MMLFEIYNRKHEDSLKVSGDSVMDIQQKAEEELKKRGWNIEDCYSEQLI